MTLGTVMIFLHTLRCSFVQNSILLLHHTNCLHFVNIWVVVAAKCLSVPFFYDLLQFFWMHVEIGGAPEEHLRNQSPLIRILINARPISVAHSRIYTVAWSSSFCVAWKATSVALVSLYVASPGIYEFGGSLGVLCHTGKSVHYWNFEKSDWLERWQELWRWIFCFSETTTGIARYMRALGPVKIVSSCPPHLFPNVFQISVMNSIIRNASSLKVLVSYIHHYPPPLHLS